MEPTEPRYESLEIIVKVREDGQTWFDVLSNIIAKDCQGDPEDPEKPCTCGLESMGGMTGTLEQCYEWGTNVSAGIPPLMVAEVIEALYDGRPHKDMEKIREWARHEIEVEEWFNNLEDEDAEEEEAGD